MATPTWKPVPEGGWIVQTREYTVAIWPEADGWRASCSRDRTAWQGGRRGSPREALLDLWRSLRHDTLGDEYMREKVKEIGPPQEK